METTLTADVRDETGKGAGRRLRAAGRVPGILYGHGMEPVKLSISGKDLLHLFHTAGGGSTLVDLKVDGTTHLVIPREIQRDHIHGRFIHIDFLAVRRDEKITLSVEVHEVGEAPGIRAGGVIEHHLREIDIECLPNDVPEMIPVDISTMEIGDLLRVGDVPVPSGVVFLTAADTPVISVITPAALRVEADLTLPGEEAPEAPAEEAEAGEEAEAAAEVGAEEGEAGEAPAEGSGSGE
jgi:large subunit ribosomal protein L25